MRKLSEKQEFSPADRSFLETTYPVIIKSENNDGSVVGYFNLDHMSAVKKVLAITN